MEFVAGPDLDVADLEVADLDVADLEDADLEVADEHLGLGDDYRPRHISPSSSYLYRQCARKWKHRYIDRLPDPSGEPALVGTFAHTVLEHLLQLPEGRRSQDAAKKLARTHWRDMERDPEFAALELSTDQARAFRWKAWLAIAGLWALENPDDTQVHATEHEVQVDIEGVPFRGIVDRIDLVDGSLVISDYKSGKAPPDQYRHRPLKQVLLYAAAVEASTGQRPIGARLLYLGQRTLGVRVTPQNLAASVNELASTWSALTSDCESGEFEATTGPLCAWCPFLSACPEGRAEVTRRAESGNVRPDAPGLSVIYAEAG